MASPVRKYHNRAFRYVLRPQDNADMRFGLRNDAGAGAIEQTTLLDLSETGASFLLGPMTDLVVNERIKVEIPIPGGEQIAWWGRVVRLERQRNRAWPFADDFDEEARVRVAVKFDNLPEGHSRAIRQGLERAFMRAMRDQQYRNWLYYRTMVMRHALKAIAILSLIAFTAGFLYYFTLPSANYDPEKGAPWGERFKLFDTK